MDYPYTSIPGSQTRRLVAAMIGGSVHRARAIFRYGGFTGTLTLDGPYIGQTNDLAPAELGSIDDGWICNATYSYDGGQNVTARVCFGDFLTVTGCECPSLPPHLGVADTNSLVSATSATTLIVDVRNPGDNAIYVGLTVNGVNEAAANALTVAWHPEYISEGDTGPGEAFAKIADVPSSNARIRTHLWRLLNPTASATGVIRFGMGNCWIAAGAWVVVGYGSQGTPATNTGTGTAASVSVGDAAAGDLILATAGAPAGGEIVITDNSDQAQTWSESLITSPGSEHNCNGGSHGADATPAWTFSVNDPNPGWQAIAVAVRGR